MIAEDRILTLDEIRRRFYGERSAPSAKKLRRWISEGVRGRKLIASKEGGVWTVRESEWIRFLFHLERTTTIPADCSTNDFVPTKRCKILDVSQDLAVIEEMFGPIS